MLKLARCRKRSRDGRPVGDAAGTAAAANEAAWLARCNGVGVGPELIAVRGGAVTMAFAEGPTIGAWLEALAAGDGAVARTVLADLLGQCRRLDAAAVDKREMHRCSRHVVVSAAAGTCTLLDFERCATSAKPQNVTGIAQYLTSAWASAQLARAAVAVDVPAARAACGRYKADRADAAFRALGTALGLVGGGGGGA